MINDPEKRLIEALKNVDAHGDVAPPHVHDPMTMVLRGNAIQAHLMQWDDARGRFALTGAGRRRISARGRAPGTILSFRKRDVLGSGMQHADRLAAILRNDPCGCFAARSVLQPLRYAKTRLLGACRPSRAFRGR